MNSARTLIDAIQSCSTCNLRRAIAQFKDQVNDELPDLGVTALHVAAKAYATHTHDRVLSGVFNLMVRMLLGAGASPFAEVGTTYKARLLGTAKVQGVDSRGLTVAEVCEGKMPPALKEWFANLPTEAECLLTHSDSPRAALVERRRLMAQVRRAQKKGKVLDHSHALDQLKTKGKARPMSKQLKERCEWVRQACARQERWSVA